MRKTTRAYFGSDQLSEQVKSNGVKEERFYLNDGRLTQMRRQRPGESTFFKDQQYTYDADANRTRDERGDYVFNARDQLVKWTRAANRAKAGTTVNYTVDGAGRITARNDSGGSTSTFHYIGDRMVDEVTGGETFLFDYDEFGSVSSIYSQTPGVFNQVFKYDAFERLKQTTSNVPTTPPAGMERGAKYEYDALDRRDRKVVSPEGQPDRTLDLSYVGLTDKLSRSEQAGGELVLFDHDSGLNRLGLKRGTNPFKAYGTDASGSVEELEDQNGQVQPRERYFYDPFGALEPQTANNAGRPDEERAEVELLADAQANPFRFQGHYYDTGSQSYDMQAREYLPRVGRFLSHDRYEDSAADLQLQTDPLTQDRYAFAGGNPVDNIELDGHRVCNGAHDCGGSSKQASRRNSNFENQKAVFSPTEQIQWNRAVNEGAREARSRGAGNRRIAAVAPLGLSAVLPSCTPGACEPGEGNSILRFLSAAGDAATRVARGGAGEAVGVATGLWETAKVCSVSTGANAKQINPACGSLPTPSELERHYLRGDPFEAGGRLIVGGAAVALTRRPSLGAAGRAGSVVTTGQRHHVISTRIGRAIDRHPTLAGQYSRRDPRFVTQAVDDPAHRGYQRWHRTLDEDVVRWLGQNRNVTPQQFEAYLRSRYSQPDLKQRFPNGF